MEPFEMNEVLAGRKILSVENGKTTGWMVINLEPTEQERTNPKLRVFLTVFVGGRNGNPEANHYSTSSIHFKDAECGCSYAVRDGRDPQMPMSSAHDGQTIRRLQREKTDARILKSIDEQPHEECPTCLELKQDCLCGHPSHQQ